MKPLSTHLHTRGALTRGLSLVLLGAGLAALPGLTSGATGAAAPAPAGAAADASLVAAMRSEAAGDLRVSRERATGKVGFVRASRNGDLMPSRRGSSAAAAVTKASAYLDKYAGAFGATRKDLQQTRVATTPVGWTITYEQVHRGVPVFGSRLRANIDREGDLTAVNGFVAPDLRLSTTPRLSPAQAGSRAGATVRVNAPGEGGADLGGVRATRSDLVVYRTGAIKGTPGASVLAYAVEVGNGRNVRDMVFVNATTGKLLNRYSMVDGALDREVIEAAGSTDPAEFEVVWREGDAFPDNLDQSQQDLVEGTGDSYWFFENSFGRDSYDGAGATMRTVNNDGRIDCPNANWNGSTTNYCDGVTSDDTVSHEWAHAYTEYTSGLIYQWQPGALNESFSDIWGESVDLLNTRHNEAPDGPREDGSCSKYSPGAVGVQINSPESIAGLCEAAPASFGPVFDTIGVTGDVVVATDDADSGSTTDGCSPFTNTEAVEGNIAYVDRGNCAFADKAANAVDAGATAVLIANNVPGDEPFSPSGSADIYGAMISYENGLKITTAPSTVNVTIKDVDTEPKTDSYRWLSGEGDPAFGGAIRDLWSPTCYGDPGKVSDAEYKCSTDDSGGVHSNSGIPNHTFALLVDGGTYNGVTVPAIGLDKAAHVFWRTQTAYLTPTSDFTDLADGLAASCNDLVGTPLTELSVETNAAAVMGEALEAADCAAVDAVATAVELRQAPAQCDFQPLLAKNALKTCGAGTRSQVVWKEDFEENLAAWSRTSQVVYPGGSSYPWRGTTKVPGGHGTRVASSRAPDEGNCSGGEGDISSRDSMVSPPVRLPSGFARRMSFQHYVATEAGYDGANVKISINGKAFQPVPLDAYLFNAPNSRISTYEEGNTNPLSGQDGFTGTDGGQPSGSWGTSTIDLGRAGAKAGDRVKVRFDLGRDGCGGVNGWYVDNVRFVVCKKHSGQGSGRLAAAARDRSPGTH